MKQIQELRAAPPSGFLAPLQLPARDIPVPSSISAQAQQMLARGPLSARADYPAPEDTPGWLDLIHTMDGQARPPLADEQPAHFGGASLHSTETLNIDGVVVYQVRPEAVDDSDPRVYLDVHGGSWIQGGGEFCKFFTPGIAALVGVRTWSVDYRMPPQHPFPAGLEDCLTVYRRLLDLHRPDQIIVGGFSAGANLVAALMLLAADRGLPLPAGVVLRSPPVDLTEAGDTWMTNLGMDTVLTASARPTIQLYAAGHDLLDPYLSPLYGDLGKGYPPALLLSGTRDLLLSDTVRFHRALLAAGIPADLHVFEAQGHGGFMDEAPEDQDRARTTRKFVDTHWPPPHILTACGPPVGSR